MQAPEAPTIIDVSHYEIDKKCIATGAWGTVHRAQHIATKQIVAMKFFGYTQQHPVNHLISEEVNCMQQLKGVKGVAQLIGVFKDTKEGLVPGKNKKFCKEGYPVIVMDYLEGGDLFSMVINRSKNLQPVNEKFLAPAFRSAMESLLSIHNRGYLHRDLKLDNMVLTSKAEDAVVKIIDCGYFCHAPAGVVQTTGLVGSPGYFAPESLQTSTGLREYSTKTDVWQAGCALYIMLSAKLPFSQKYEDFGKIIAGEYFSLDSYVWEDISPRAKSLVAGMLQRNPRERLSVHEVLTHPWLANTTELSSTPLGNGYMLRMGGFDLRQKLKIGFQAGKIEENHKELKENFQEELPYFMDPSFVDRDKNELDMEASDLLTSEEFQENLKALKKKIMERINYNIATGQARLKDTEKNEVFLTAPPTLERERSSVYGDEIDFEEFVRLVTGCNLECLATEKIFSIFDVSKDGLVNMKEFLFALMALRPFDAAEGSSNSDVTEAALYFHFFDMDEDGYIELQELKFAFNCLFQDCYFGDSALIYTDEEVEDGKGELSVMKKFDAEAVFNQIDTDNAGRIDINKFKKFYDYVLTASVSQKICSTIAGSVGQCTQGSGIRRSSHGLLKLPLSLALSHSRGNTGSAGGRGRQHHAAGLSDSPDRDRCCGNDAIVVNTKKRTRADEDQ